MIRVLLVDDHASSRQPLAILLERDPAITVVAQAGTVAEARSALKTTAVDVAVVDLGLPDGDGVDLVKDIHAANPHGQVLVLTAQTDRRELARAAAAGAAGILNKAASIDEIIDAVQRLGAGEEVLSPSLLIELLRLAGQERERNIAAQTILARLTPRERDVLQALAEGLSDKDIGRRFQISEKTVRAHMANLLTKLEVDSRLQALVFAIRHSAVEIR
jgi:DNA-binding NarL/FixJ family response regulator